ncbi:MAG: hypothetical protein ABFD64_04070 [Armatimonadota bacterium]
MCKTHLFILVLFTFVILPSCVSAQNSKAISTVHKEQQKTVLQYSHPINGVSVAPSGKSLVYIVGDELKDWPKGRILKLPDGFINDPDIADIPLAWNFKWRNDEQELLVSRAGTNSYMLIDMESFKIEERFYPVFSVWWSSDDICYVPAVNEYKFWSSTKHSHYCNGERFDCPKGMMITDVSAGGEVMLARAAGNSSPESNGLPFINLAVIRTSPKSKKIEWQRFLYKKPTDVTEYHDADIIRWNSNISTAAVVAGNDTGGGLSTGSLYVVTKDKVVELQDYIEYYWIWLESPPDWVGNKILTVIRLRSEIRDPDTKNATPMYKFQLILFDPEKGKIRKLLEESNLVFSDTGERWFGDEALKTASSSRDGKLLVYVIASTKDKSWKLVLTSLGGFSKP